MTCAAWGPRKRMAAAAIGWSASLLSSPTPTCRPPSSRPRRPRASHGRSRRGRGRSSSWSYLASSAMCCGSNIAALKASCRVCTMPSACRAGRPGRRATARRCRGRAPSSVGTCGQRLVRCSPKVTSSRSWPLSTNGAKPLELTPTITWPDATRASARPCPCTARARSVRPRRRHQLVHHEVRRGADAVGRHRQLARVALARREQVVERRSALAVGHHACRR